MQSEHTRSSPWYQYRATTAKVLAKAFNYPQHAHGASASNAVAHTRSAAVRERESTAWLDGLRGIAAFQVMLFHYADFWCVVDVPYGHSPGQSTHLMRLPMIRSSYAAGRAMVCTFFVISGFVLTQRTLADLRAHRITQAATRLSSALFRRGMRLFAPAMVIAVMAFFLVRLGFRCALNDPGCPYFPSLWDQFVDWFKATLSYLSPFEYQNFGGSLAHKYENIIWTLPMEMFGSLWCYFILLATLRLQPRPRNWIVLGCGLYAVANTAWGVFCFMAGMLIADWMLVQEDQAAEAQSLDVSTISATATDRETPPRLRQLGKTVAWTVVLILGITFAGAPMRGPVEDKAIVFGFNWWWRLAPERWTHSDCNYWGFSWSGIMIVSSISQLPYAKRFCTTTPAIYLGKVSFSVYLLHISVRDVLGRYLQGALLTAMAPAMQITQEGAAEPLSVADLYARATSTASVVACSLWFVIMSTVVFALSGQFEKHIDAPLVKMTRHIEEWAISIDRDDAFYEKT